MAGTIKKLITIAVLARGVRALTRRVKSADSKLFPGAKRKPAKKATRPRRTGKQPHHGRSGKQDRAARRA